MTTSPDTPKTAIEVLDKFVEGWGNYALGIDDVVPWIEKARAALSSPQLEAVAQQPDAHVAGMSRPEQIPSPHELVRLRGLLRQFGVARYNMGWRDARGNAVKQTEAAIQAEELAEKITAALGWQAFAQPANPKENPHAK